MFILVSFGVSGTYLAFQMVVIDGFITRLRGWRPDGEFTLGRWGMPVYVLAMVYGILMIVNIVFPSGVSSGKGLFNYDWMTLVIMIAIVLLGAIYYAVARPGLRITRSAEDRAEARSKSNAA